MELRDLLGSDGLDLLWQLLDIDPRRRPSAEQALQHPFFSGLAQPEAPLTPTYEGEIPLSHLPYYASLMRSQEQRLRPAANFMTRQQSISENMRAILVDWLVDVSVHFNVMSETLHYAVNYIDRALAQMQVEKTKLQLVGVACMKIADVFNEKSKEYYRQENSAEYSYITADEYSP